MEETLAVQEGGGSALTGEIGALLLGALGRFVYPRKLGRLFASGTTFQPDGFPPFEPNVSFATLERMPERVDEDATIAPDLPRTSSENTTIGATS